MYAALRYFFVAYAVFFFYTYIPAYLFIVHEFRLTPAMWLTVLWAFALFVLLGTESARAMLRTPLSIWCYGYMFIVSCSAILAPSPALDTSAYSDAVVWSISVVVMQVIFSGDEKFQRFARYSILVGLILAMATCVLDFVNPGNFVPFDHPSSNPGRAAGFYVNANSAGFAMISGAIASIGLLNASLRPALIAAVSGAIVLTFSRGAFLVWSFVILYWYHCRTVTLRDLGVALAAMLVLSIVIATAFASVQLEQSSINNILERTEWLSNPLDIQDDSGLERAGVLRLAWIYFLQSPAFGHGLGTTYLWEERSGTHNIYMELVVQFGLFGPLLLLWLFYGVAYKTTLTSKTMCRASILAFIFWGLFSHNLLSDYSIPVMFALISAMGHSRPTRLPEMKLGLSGLSRP